MKYRMKPVSATFVLVNRKPFITELFEEPSYLFSTWSTSQFCCWFFFWIYVASAMFQSYFAEKTNLWYCSGETENTGPLAPQAKSLTNKPPLMSYDFHNHAEQVATWNRHSQSLSSIFFALCVTMLILSCDLLLIFIHVLVILLCTHQQNSPQLNMIWK